MYVHWHNNPQHFHKLFFSGVGFGLALACKWTAFYILPILAIDQVSEILRRNYPSRKTCFWFFISFGIMGPLIYLLSYCQYFLLGFSVEQFWALQKQMWGYHTGLKASHDYASSPWQWVLNLKPVWMYVDYSHPGKIGNIYDLGNSIILWSGIGAIFFAMEELWKTWKWELWFLMLTYFLVWLPWTFSPRIMLFYHYAPAVPTLCIVLARTLDEGFKIPRVKRICIAILVLSILWFTVFYPHNTGIAVPKSFASKVYFALPGWK